MINQEERKKLYDAGLGIMYASLRAERLCIMACTPEKNNPHELASGFKSFAALERKLAELAESPKMVDFSDLAAVRTQYRGMKGSSQ